jgi:hypothetical protein
VNHFPNRDALHAHLRNETTLYATLSTSVYHVLAPLLLYTRIFY